MKPFRFFLTYILGLVISFTLALYLDKIGLNESLKEYYDFVGDILNFSSILTGFLGAVISVLTSISKSSPIITRVLRSKKALNQLITSMGIPFFLGFVVIFLSMIYRLKLKNELFLSTVSYLNVTLLTLTMYFVVTSILMTVIIFFIFFLEGISNDQKKGTDKLRPRLKGRSE